MTITNDEEQFRRSCTEQSVFSPTKNKPVCDAHGQLQTAKTREGYGLARLLKEIETTYNVLIQDVGTNMIVPKRRSSETEQYPFFFYVDNVGNALKDATENLHFHICAFINKGWTVLRDTKFEVSPLVLLPYTYSYSAENEPTSRYHIGLKHTDSSFGAGMPVSKEVTLDYLTKKDSLKLKCKFSNIPYDSQWSDGQYRQEFVCMAEFEEINVEISDDYGLQFGTFSDNAQFSCEQLPEELAGTTYTLENKINYAPLTTSDSIYCILYADKKNSVRVLRWNPTTKEDMHDKPLLSLYVTGTISSNQSEELYNLMTSTGNIMLFGSITGNSVSIICNMDGYYNSELRDFVLPIELFNLAK